MHKHYGAVIMLGAFGLLVLGIGLSLVGSPISQKKIRLDEIRISDFSNLKYDVESYYRNNKILPLSLKDLNAYNNIIDPETQKEYEYKKTSDFTYEFCTVFSTDSEEVAKRQNKRNYYDSYSGTNQKHKEGYDCIIYQIPQYDRSPVNIQYTYPTPQVYQNQKTSTGSASGI
jgi:hypothetical protein